MPQPAALEQFASDPLFTSGPEAGNALRTNPGSAVIAQGFVPGVPFVGQYWNYVLNNYYLWLNYLKNLDTDSYFLGRPYSWTAAHTFGAGATVSSGNLAVTTGNISAGNAISASFGVSAGTEFGYIGTHSRTMYISPSFMCGQQATDYWAIGAASVGVAGAVTAAARGEICLSNFLPNGATITKIRVGGTKAAGGTLTITGIMRTIDTVPPYSTSASSSTVLTLSTATAGDLAPLDSGAISLTIDNTAVPMWLLFQAGAALDLIVWIEVTFTDPGPRNF